MKSKFIALFIILTVSYIGKVHCQTLNIPGGTTGIGSSTNGNVGVGTTTPLSNLEVANSSGAVLSISTNRINGSMASPLRPTIDFLGYANGNKARISATEQTYDTHGSKLSMFVNDGSSSTSLVERLTISMYGNVGIGNTTPTQALNVVGRVAITTGTYSDEGYNGNLMITKPASSGQYINLIRQGQYPWSIGTVYNTSNFAIGTGISSDVSFTNPFFVINTVGDVGIGTVNPAYKLDVLGTIRAKEVLVNLGGGADFVFEKDYKLPTIEHVANYVQENKHLPDVPSANEMVKNGVSMGDMQVKLLQKVEELTLYVIELKKEINILKQEHR